MARQEHFSARPDNGVYQYVRRVPLNAAKLDPRGTIRQSLATKDPIEAALKARAIDQSLEALWTALVKGDVAAAESWERYEAAVATTNALGFRYREARDFSANGAFAELLDRMRVAHGSSDAVAEGVVGLIEQPQIRLSQLWGHYERHRSAELMGLSPAQLRSHRLGRERAIGYLIAVIGDKVIAEITRDDVLAFRDWWIVKIAAEGLKAYSANRSFTDLSGMMRVLDDANRTNWAAMWEKVRVGETDSTALDVRVPYSIEFVQKRLLQSGAFDSLKLQARLIIYGMIETGLRPGEICNARAEDIHLGGPIPYVAVAKRTDRRQKSKNAVRTVPLVGVSLWAFRQMPEGLPDYRDNANSASAAINAALDRLKLKETPDHVLYSLRHTFQDRVLAANAPDRVQADLMGHAFERPKYGEGAHMKQKHELLKSIAFQWPAA